LNEISGLDLLEVLEKKPTENEIVKNQEREKLDNSTKRKWPFSLTLPSWTSLVNIFSWNKHEKISQFQMQVPGKTHDEAGKLSHEFTKDDYSAQPTSARLFNFSSVFTIFKTPLVLLGNFFSSLFKR
jgi:hypothetical protein